MNRVPAPQPFGQRKTAALPLIPHAGSSPAPSLQNATVPSPCGRLAATEPPAGMPRLRVSVQSVQLPDDATQATLALPSLTACAEAVPE